MKNSVNYFLTALRILTGWLFLYEGIDKLLEPGWSTRCYLLGSRWIFSGFFEWIAGSSFLMSAVDQQDIESIWCDDPQKTMEFMSGLEEPWIAFKVLAAGAIRPEEGFPAAIEAGADFICVGMYDFQIVQDSNIALDAFANVKQRSRPWRG